MKAIDVMKMLFFSSMMKSLAVTSLLPTVRRILIHSMNGSQSAPDIATNVI